MILWRGSPRSGNRTPRCVVRPPRHESDQQPDLLDLTWLTGEDGVVTRPLQEVLAAELAASGLDEQTQLSPDDVRYVANGLRGVFSGLKARHAWEASIGPILTHKQTLEVTGWTKQALSQAVREHRVLRVEAEDGSTGYVVAGFDGASPARPLVGIKEVLRVWAAADEHGWMTASWLSTEQLELGGRSPRQALLDGDLPAVVDLARQATARLAARATPVPPCTCSHPLHPTSCATASPAGNVPPAPGCSAPTEPHTVRAGSAAADTADSISPPPTEPATPQKPNNSPCSRPGQECESCPALNSSSATSPSSRPPPPATWPTSPPTPRPNSASPPRSSPPVTTSAPNSGRLPCAPPDTTASDTGRGTTSPTPMAASRFRHRRRAHRCHAARLHRDNH